MAILRNWRLLHNRWHWLQSCERIKFVRKIQLSHKRNLPKMTNDSDISAILETYKNVALVPTPCSATLRPINGSNLINIHSTWSIPDVIRSESTNFTREYLLDFKSGNFSLLSAGIPSDESSVCKRAFTKTGSRYAVFRKTKKSDDSIFLEIWNTCKKESTFDLNDSKEHGMIQKSGFFSSLKWSSNERYILYIADAKRKKTESFFKDVFCKKQDATSNKNDESKPSEVVIKGEEFLYRETWGEQCTNAHHTVLCIFDVVLGKVEVLNLDEKFPNVSVAQAIWGPDDEYILFVGYEEVPFRLGVLFCNNRRSAIFSYNLRSKVVERLTPEENICVYYPAFSPDFNKFVYLQNKYGGPHMSTQKLMKYDWKTKEISTIIDVVESSHGSDFAGMYTENLSSRWWSNDSRFLFFDNMQKSFREICCVDMLTSKVQRVNFGEHKYSCSILDVQEPYIVAAISSCTESHSLIIGHFSIADDKIKTTWSCIEEDSPCKFNDLCWKVDTLTPSLQNEKYPNLNYDIITIWPKEGKNGSLIIFPHGGPHSAFSIAYDYLSAAFAKLGFIVCKVNYRGSIGFGENNINSLPGNVGTQDVSDVIDAVEFLKKNESLGIKDIIGFGGSHGGFLIAHLLGQYPSLLKAAVIRNPVTDLTSMVGTTDIGDWCWIEAGCSEMYDTFQALDPSNLKKLWDKSPIKYVKNVITPTLLCLGKVDLRVPACQGLQFHRQLKAQNVPTKIFYYDDCHSLSKVEVSCDVFVNTLLWFKAY